MSRRNSKPARNHFTRRYLLRFRKLHSLQAGLSRQLHGESFYSRSFLPAVAYSGAVPCDVATGNVLVEIRFGGMSSIVKVQIFVNEVVIGVRLNVQFHFFLRRDSRG